MLARRLYQVFFGAFFCMLLTAPFQEAYAWGHSRDLDSAWHGAHLVFPVLKHGTIRYCLEIDPRDPEAGNRFPDPSVDAQLLTVLNVWLRPVYEAGLADKVSIVRVTCDDPSVNLRVLIGEETKYVRLGAYQIIGQGSAGQMFSTIKIATQFLWKNYGFVDTASFFRGNGFYRVLQEIAFEDGYALNSFSSKYGLDRHAVFWSTYRVLLHELGHSFGLCDTIESQLGRCDHGFLTDQRKNSVMSDSWYMSLTSDDREGILQLFRRFQHLRSK